MIKICKQCIEYLKFSVMITVICYIMARLFDFIPCIADCHDVFCLVQHFKIIDIIAEDKGFFRGDAKFF